VTPSVGRSVHVVERDWGNPSLAAVTVCRAATITEVPVPGGVADMLDAVHVVIFRSGELAFKQYVPYDVQHAPGTWHWPERVE
jgi:hypothetical protein